jgi:hypothetical protein
MFCSALKQVSCASLTRAFPRSGASVSLRYRLALAFSFALACLLSASALAAPAPPVITVQPTSQALALGATLNLSVTATGTLPLSYQWRLNGAALPGATSPIFLLLNVQESLQGNYTVVVSNSGGAVTSAVAVVTIHSPPLLYDLGQPQPLTVFAGPDATFTVTAVGDQPFTYQWRWISPGPRIIRSC